MPTVLTQYIPAGKHGDVQRLQGRRAVIVALLEECPVFVTLYLNVIAPDRIVLAMLTVGAVSALIAWDKRALAFAVEPSCFLCRNRSLWLPRRIMSFRGWRTSQFWLATPQKALYSLLALIFNTVTLPRPL